MRGLPAIEIEALVVKAVREHLKLEEPNDDAGIIKAHVVRVEIQADQLVVQLTSTQKSKRGRPSAGNPLHVPWHKTSSVKRREILLPDKWIVSNPKYPTHPFRNSRNTGGIDRARTGLARRNHC